MLEMLCLFVVYFIFSYKAAHWLVNLLSFWLLIYTLIYLFICFFKY